MNDKVIQEKKPYEKPTLHVIDLVADEVLGTGCKTAGSGGGYTGANCQVGSCLQNGS